MNERQQMQFLYEIFDGSLPRHGPGDDVSTRRALSILLPSGTLGRGAPTARGLLVLDIGCGTGPQTIQLAKHIEGMILAEDNH